MQQHNSLINFPDIKIISKELSISELTSALSRYNSNNLIQDIYKNLDSLMIYQLTVMYQPLFQKTHLYTLYALPSSKSNYLKTLLNIKQTLAVIGTRSCHIEAYKNSYKFIKIAIAETNARILISGGAKGCDTTAENFAHKYNFPFIKITPTIFTAASYKNFWDIKQIKDRQLSNNSIIISPALIIPNYKFKYYLRFRNFFITLFSNNILSLQTPSTSGTLIALQYALHYNKNILFPKYKRQLLQSAMYLGQLKLSQANIGRILK